MPFVVPEPHEEILSSRNEDVKHLTTVMISTIYFQSSNELVTMFTHHYDQCMFVVVNATCIGLEDPIKIITLLSLFSQCQHALYLKIKSYCLDSLLNEKLV